MIREVTRCPYCGHVSAGLDDDRPELVMAPDRADGRPCEHLAFVCVVLDVGPAGTEDRVLDRSGQWLWVRGEGLRVIGFGPSGQLAGTVSVIACELLPDEERLVTPYRVAGGTASEREDDRRGGGNLRPTGPGGERLEGVLGGWGSFPTTPDAPVAEVRRLAGREAPGR